MMEDSSLQNSGKKLCSDRNESILEENNKIKQKFLTKNIEKMNYERFNLEIDRPTENLDSNWSWKEKGNEQYKVCSAPDSSLLEHSPVTITPLTQKKIGSITENLLLDQNYKLNKAIDTFVEKEIDKDVNEFHGKKQGDYVESEDGTAFLVG
ncbi:hypothetical protein C2G38_1544172 [Gigaspora rosea]|uniref:Uncharacterized protein n=1 Tax=Gigaspora rosea TaxID=44941 RepID=A0A397V0E3_9GLOM|nr:hypothetical protein C2G38_1544172 [Gigaspora rosea]